jgi:hypothetical protein
LICSGVPAWRAILALSKSGPEDGVAGLVVGNRLEVHVHFAFGGFHLEAWLTSC